VFNDILNPFWLAAFSAALFIGIGKGGFGGGIVAMATPLFALVSTVSDAAATLLPVLLAADVFAVYQYRKRFDKANLQLLLPSGIVGIILATLFLVFFSTNERLLKLSIGLIAVGFVIFQLSRTLILKQLEATRPKPVWGTVLGLAAGFSSTLAHVGGPPVMMYLLPQKLPKDVFVGTNAILFFSLNLIKLIPYFFLGLLSIGNLSVSLSLIPVALIGTRLGLYLNRVISQQVFNNFIYIVLFLTGMQLIIGRSFVSLLAF